mgnify:FL=1
MGGVSGDERPLWEVKLLDEPGSWARPRADEMAGTLSRKKGTHESALLKR